jgi:hypothetical protein
MKNIIFLFIIALLMNGCKKEVQCINYNIDAAFIGFQKSDLDTIILRKYAPDNNFSQLIDSFILINDTSQLQRNDTIRIAMRRAGASVLMGFGNDWQIFIPSKNRVVSVSHIVAEQNSIKCGFSIDPHACDCFNKISSLKQDDSVLSLINVNTNMEGYFIYITD